MPFDRVFFLFEFLPAVLAAYYLALQAERIAGRRVAWAADLSAWVLVIASAVFIWRSGVDFFRLPSVASGLVPAGSLVVACQAVAFAVDFRRKEASADQPLTVALYLAQFPLLVAGPIVRFRDTSAQRAHRTVGMGPFTYGVRRVVTGLVKVVLVARTLGRAADTIFALPNATLGADVAWLGAVCFSLQVYFQCSGYADVAIGLGRMFGLRYPENFRRPYTAESVRDFWRHWNITLITWLRDYMYLPIAGRDNPTPRLYVNIVAGFCVVGLWHGARGNVLFWSVYSGMWLALEAVGLGARMERLPSLIRHAYLLVVVIVGWVILRAGSVSAAVGFLEAMGGLHGMSSIGAGRYLSTGGWIALATAVLFAGPLVPWISRWRVSVDAATASLLMMLTAMALLLWRGVSTVVDAVRNRNAVVGLLTGTALLALAGAARAQQSVELSRLSLEDLLNVDVTSVSRRAQPLATSPAAVFVISQDDIRRSGLSSLPEILRLAPGVQVSRYSGSKWSVSARGMGSYYSNKLLVLIDGRSVYTPDFSGVYWDLHDVPIDDIERIEVVRGPGGTLWGANAVNGVINIITRSSTSTTGTSVTLESGTEDRGLFTARYGGAAGAGTTYRVSGRVADRRSPTSDPLDDTARIARAGFRLDRAAGADRLMLESSAFTGRERAPLSVPDLVAPYLRVLEDHVDVGGAVVQGRWTRSLTTGGHVAVGAYVDHTRRDEFIHDFHSDAFDVDFEHAVTWARAHDVVWGAEFRYTLATMRNTNPSVLAYEPPRTGRELFSAFVQDEVAIGPRLSVIFGTKVEHHETVGRAIEPNARVMWTAAPRQRLWAAASRGVRTPSLADQNAVFRYLVVPPSPASLNLPVEVTVAGDPGTALEHVVAYEAGYRTQPLDTLAVDVAVFRNQYNRLSSYMRGPTMLAVADGGPYLALTSLHENQATGESHGLEATVTWTPVGRWSLSGSATVLRTNLHITDSTVDAGNSLLVQLLSPGEQFTARSSVQLSPKVDADVSYFRSGEWQSGDVAPYSRVDARVGWEIGQFGRLDAGVQNLFDVRHVETALFLFETPTDIQRSAYARLSWAF